MRTRLAGAAGAVAVSVLACYGLAATAGPAVAARVRACRAGSLHVDGTMAAVAADSARTAWAVGSSYSTGNPVIARWNGRCWRQVPGAAGGAGGYLTGVAAISPPTPGPSARSIPRPAPP